MSRARENADGARLDAPLASPAFTGTPTGITAAHLEAGVLPADVTGGSGLTALGTVTAGTIGSGVTFPTGHILQVQGNSTSRVTNSGQNSRSFAIALFTEKLVFQIWIHTNFMVKTSLTSN